MDPPLLKLSCGVVKLLSAPELEAQAENNTATLMPNIACTQDFDRFFREIFIMGNFVDVIVGPLIIASI
ncbi:hypothetical protein LIHA111178_06405 [Litorimonas haliclonae]